ncbi:PDGLE domain-containing protein, partial [Streptomyces sp. GC420]|uniref:PDGLE domain-containing protein n=1 Tax=Streptomyces sp. GC420 TaxID=2697568 RepID=UPI001AA13613
PGAVRSTRRPLLAGLAAALLCAGVLSFYASASPDGLEKVAADHGIDEKTEEHGTADSPLADYGVENVGNERLSGGLAGVIGVGATLAVGSGVFLVVRRRDRGNARDGRDEHDGRDGAAGAAAGVPAQADAAAGGKTEAAV